MAEKDIQDFFAFVDKIEAGDGLAADDAPRPQPRSAPHESSPATPTHAEPKPSADDKGTLFDLVDEAEPTPESGEPNRGDQQAAPSGCLGYGIAGLVTGLGVLLYFMATFEPGEQYYRVPWFVAVGSAVAFFGIASAINRARRYRGTAGQTVKPVVDRPAPEPRHGSEQTPAIREPGPVRESRADTQLTADSTAGPPGIRTAGRWEGDRFVVAAHEIDTVLADPNAFDNVLVASETAEGISSVTPDWLLVLARGSAIAIRQDRSQIWSLDPRCEPWTLLSVDGRTQCVRFPDPASAACFLAWRCDSWREFVHPSAQDVRTPPKALPRQWALLVWSLETGKNPACWLKFPLPYSSVREGLSQLCRRDDDLLKVVHSVGWQVAIRWTDQAAPEDAQVIMDAVREAMAERCRYYTQASILAYILGALATVSSLVALVHKLATQGQLEEGKYEHLLAALGLGALFLAIGVGSTLYARHVKSMSRGTPREILRRLGRGGSARA